METLAPTIFLAHGSDEIAQCFEVMHELRPHLQKDAFVAQVLRQQTQGYHLAYLLHEGKIRSVTGYRLLENLAWGRLMYIDDLATRSVDQGGGYGSRLFDWLVVTAREAGCSQLHLDSGVQRHGAHRFYLHKKMDITCHHFALSGLALTDG